MAKTLYTLDFYLDRAKVVGGFKSDNALNYALGFRGPAVSLYRTKRTWPSDETMIRIAVFAGENPTLALVHLSTWRSTGPAAEKWAELAADMARQITIAKTNKRGTTRPQVPADCILWKIPKIPTIAAIKRQTLRDFRPLTDAGTAAKRPAGVRDQCTLWTRG